MARFLHWSRGILFYQLDFSDFGLRARRENIEEAAG